MAIEFACPKCRKRFRVKDELSGRTAKCDCGTRLRIPQSKTKQAASTSAARTSSSKTAAVAAKPRPVAKTASVGVTSDNNPQLQAAASDLSSWLDEELESAAPAATGPAASADCPGCGVPLAAGTVICVACGYDTRTGHQHTTEHGPGKLAGSTKGRGKHSTASLAGSFLQGTVYSLIGAVLGAVVWAVIANLVDREFGIIAIGLGALAGIGMSLGHEDDSGVLAGIIAGCMSLVGIVVAKSIIVTTLMGQIAEELQPLDLQRATLVQQITEEELQSQGLSSEQADAQQWQTAYTAAEADVDQLTDQQVNERVGADGQATADLDPAALQAVESIAFAVLLGVSLLYPMNLLWMVLAFGTAFKLGSGRMTD